MKQWIALLCIAFSISICAQNQIADSSFFLIEEEEFSPPVEAMIRQFEGGPVTPIMAQDIFGTMHEINEYQGKKTCLIFCNFKEEKNKALIASFNRWQQSQTKSFKIIFLVDEPKEELSFLTKENLGHIAVIPNCRMLSEAVYGVEIGNPRLFFVDESGNIQKVYSSKSFNSHARLFQSLDLLLLQ